MSDTLWKRCFWDEVAAVKLSGAEKVEFKNIDERVIAASHLPIPELLKFIEEPIMLSPTNRAEEMEKKDES